MPGEPVAGEAPVAAAETPGSEDRAGRLLEEIHGHFLEWQTDRGNPQRAEAIRGNLRDMGSVAAAAESESLAGAARRFDQALQEVDADAGPSDDDFRILNGHYQEVLKAVGSLATAVDEEPEAEAVVEAVAGPGAEAQVTAPAGEVSAADEPVGEATGKDAQHVPEVAVEVPAPHPERKVVVKLVSGEAPEAEVHEEEQKRASQEMVRVSSDLLDELVNLAAETSINRARIGQQIGDFGFTLDELESTIERLREQLRRLDMETEAQVTSRMQVREESPEEGDFDPLEMDRYSKMQQLSRSLLESASDLLDLKQTLAERTRDTETLIIQQSRVQSELQESLTRTRMVPFSRMTPRLSRIVRQVSGELKKKVRFDVVNAESEMDRAVLERMVAPLEHMLRNACDHGIETVDKRRAAGKPETGTVTLTLSSEGNDIVLELEDDGGGIPKEAIRKKAVERGLMSADDELSDFEVLQFILQAGFSTAEKVSQISGRGVGMDVVHSEIKQLGGRMFIESAPAKGTKFTVLLPSSVALSRALMARVGREAYAIPLNSIEGVVRVSPFELQELYKKPEPKFAYSDQDYALHYLGSLFASSLPPPRIDMDQGPVPLLLVSSGEFSGAFQVDALMGSREVVVKPLGGHFRAIDGVSGATILGDGRVVVILDVPALIRLQSAETIRDATARAEEQAAERVRTIRVLVVDDSVTVRKVTSRLLQRHGMDPLLAKDGIEAISLLEKEVPDIMLLDVEMPRMDGFEVATQVRRSERLKGLPIIMITSRTGAKHKERALTIGVNEYLGKPFQEDNLLSTIRRLTGTERDD